jgi:uncharacterized protein YkwD
MKNNKIWRKFPFLVLTATLILLGACAGTQPSGEVAIPPVRDRPRISIPGLEQRIHALINKERQGHGLSKLRWDESLSKIARKYSADMAKRSYFSHYSPEGHNFSYRYKQAEYSCAVPVGATIYMGAENIFQNNLYDQIVYVDGVPHYDWNSMEKIAETTVQGWMNSPGHRKNILTPHWINEGIGVAISPDDKVYITQNFC